MTPADSIRELRGAPHTLTISLRARADAAKRTPPTILDPLAVTLSDRLGVEPLDGGFPDSGIESGTAARTIILDSAVRDFVSSHRDVSVVTVGAGLCTRFDRLSDLDVRWFHIDLPEVAAIRDLLLPDSDAGTTIAASAADLVWMTTVRERVPGPVIVIVEGLSMYLSEAEMRTLMGGLADSFPGGEIWLEASGRMSVRSSSRMRALARSGAEFTWGCDDFVEVAAWHDGLELVETKYVMHGAPPPIPWQFRLMRFIPPLSRQAKIGRFRVAS